MILSFLFNKTIFGLVVDLLLLEFFRYRYILKRDAYISFFQLQTPLEIYKTEFKLKRATNPHAMMCNRIIENNSILIGCFLA